MIIDLKGRKVGRLLVLRLLGLGPPMWACACDCGKEIIVRSDLLTRQRVRSCGCLKSDKARERVRTHGQSGTRTHRAWTAMLSRCRNPNRWDFKYYGGRGIRVCDRWLRFENFLADMGEAPRGLEIDRANNSGNYEPTNCRWVTRNTNATNTRSVLLVAWQGITDSVSGWSRRLKIDRHELAEKIRSGIKPEELFPGRQAR